MVNELEPRPSSFMQPPQVLAGDSEHSIASSVSDIYGSITTDTWSNAASSNVISGLVNNSGNMHNSSLKSNSINNERGRRKILLRRGGVNGDDTYNNNSDVNTLEDDLPFQSRAQRLLHWIVIGRDTRLRNTSSEDTAMRVGGVPIRKNYQAFTGDIWFLFGGRMISSRGKPLNIIILSVMLIAGGLFFGFL